MAGSVHAELAQRQRGYGGAGHCIMVIKRLAGQGMSCPIRRWDGEAWAKGDVTSNSTRDIEVSEG